MSANGREAGWYFKRRTEKTTSWLPSLPDQRPDYWNGDDWYFEYSGEIGPRIPDLAELAELPELRRESNALRWITEKQYALKICGDGWYVDKFDKMFVKAYYKTPLEAMEAAQQAEKEQG